MISMDGHTYYWLGWGKCHHLQGVAIGISSRRQPSVIEISSNDERIMALRLKHTRGFLFLVAVYAPTDVCKLDVKEVFYAKPSSVVDKCPGEAFALHWATSMRYPAVIELAPRYQLVSIMVRELISTARTAFFTGTLLGPKIPAPVIITPANIS